MVASAMGALWGFGHSTGQLLLGLAMVLLKVGPCHTFTTCFAGLSISSTVCRVQERFHDFVPALERWSGIVIALTLIGIGAMGIYESYFAKVVPPDCILCCLC
jgi:hypothetical protein